MSFTIEARRSASMFALAVVTALAAVAAGSATTPGSNGSIAFRRYFDDQQTWGAVFTVQPDGTDARQITRPPQGVVDDQPDWAPDGSLIAFTRCAPGDGTCHVWTVSPDGSGIGPVGALCPPGSHETTCPDEGHASFSPDSKRLVFVQATGRVKEVPVTGSQIEHAAVAIMNRDGSGRHVIYRTSRFAADIDYPMFSPDGTEILFERHNSGLSKPVDKHAIFIVRADGSNLRRLTPWAENDGDNPDWSPDGQWILFHSYVDDPSGQAQYFLIHPDGTGRAQLTHFPRGTHLGSASFSPDGSSIVFSKGPEGGNIDLFTMSIDGTQLHRVTRSKLWDSAPDWGPGRSGGLRMPAAAGVPAGSWRVVVTKHDLIIRGVIGSDISGNYGVWNWLLTPGHFVERQQESAGGPVVDRHRGRVYTFADGRVCFVDTGEHLALGCFTWRTVGNRLSFGDPRFTGSIALGDGPGIMKAVFTAHAWQRIARIPALAAP